MCQLVGAFGFMWFICWHVMVYETPYAHPRIDQDELVYIKNSINESSEKQGTKRVCYYLYVYRNS